ncbi:MAG: hemerythrin domain-containing protein [Acidobacteriia bacterium]|nr:hemerythrin domain-containing protein [Terriglobia bacterium]
MGTKTIKGRNRDRNARQATSFLDLLNTHHEIFEVFLEHQEALLREDFPLALRRLKSYERKIKRHIREEEEFLMPIYSRAGKVPGGDPQLFFGEHQRIAEFIDRLKKIVSGRKGQGRNATRQAIEILYQEAMFRWLIEHHDEREKHILYPTLDRLTTAAERKRILRKVISSQLSVAS